MVISVSLLSHTELSQVVFAGQPSAGDPATCLNRGRVIRAGGACGGPGRKKVGAHSPPDGAQGRLLSVVLWLWWSRLCLVAVVVVVVGAVVVVRASWW